MSLILAGETIPTPGVEVLSWLEHGLAFRVWQDGARPRSEPPSLVVLHCTAAENSARQVFASLSARDLSVEFVLDGQGQVWQFADPAKLSCAHVGGLGRRAVGIEIVNPVMPIVPNARGRPISERIVQVCDPKPGDYPGDWTHDRQGHRLYYRRSRRLPALGLFPAQLAALRTLVEVLCTRLSIPHARADARDYVPVAERGVLRGVLGHVQCSLRHGDPSLDALAVVEAA